MLRYSQDNKATAGKERTNGSRMSQESNIKTGKAQNTLRDGEASGANIALSKSEILNIKL